MTPLAFVTCVWKRHDLAAAVLDDLGRKLEPSDALIVVGSEGEESSNVVPPRSIFPRTHYIERPNAPLGAKWQAGIEYARETGVDGVVILGSDDILSAEYVAAARKAVADGIDVFGVTDVFVWRPVDDRCVYWPGYAPGNPRHGEPIGTGRTYSRRFLDSIGWMLFPPYATHGLDHATWKEIRGRTDARVVVRDMADAGPIVDVKTDPGVDIGRFEQFEDGSLADDAARLIDARTRSLILEIADPFRGLRTWSHDKEPHLAAAMIVKNEGANIRRCLDSLVGVVDEVVAIVDEWSTDRTEAILRFAGARVYRAPWHGFGEQRNISLRSCRAPWALVIDADETIEGGAAIRDAIDSLPDDVNGLALGVSTLAGSGDGYLARSAVRVIRTNGTAHYKYRRHNELLGITGWRTVPGATIHTSYCGSLERKARASLDDLLAEVVEDPADQHGPFYLARAYRALGDMAEAKKWAGRVIAIDSSTNYAAGAAIELVHAVQATEGFEAGDECLMRMTRLYPGCADLWHSWLGTILVRWAQATLSPGPYRFLPQVSTPAMAVQAPAIGAALRLPCRVTIERRPADGPPTTPA